MPGNQGHGKDSGPSRDGEPEKTSLAKYLRYSYVGFQFFASVGLLTAGGLWLDWRLGIKFPIFTLLGLALGFGAGVYSLYRELFPARRPGGKPGGGDKGRPG